MHDDTRGRSVRQVTIWSYPVHADAADTSPSRSVGEGIVADRGSWRMLHASSTAPGSPPVASRAPGGGWSRVGPASRGTGN